MTENTRGLDIKSDQADYRPRGKNYLFCIGIDQYEHWPILKSAVKDAREIGKLLVKYYQFESSHTVTLYDEKATRQAVFAGLQELTDKITENDNLVIYYSGHGFYDKDKEITYWIPVEAEMGTDHAINWINTETLISYLKPIKSFHIFLIIDSCFSGTLFQYRAANPKGENYKSRTALASGREEVVMDSLSGGHSPFAQGVIEVLENTSDKFIRASKLVEGVKSFLENNNIGQTPVDGRILAKPYDENGDFVFHLKISEAESWAKAVATGTADGFKNFIEHFPDSNHFLEAQEAHHWLSAKEANTISQIRDYLNSYPQGKYFSAATALMAQIEEEVLWSETLDKDRLSAYYNYLHQYPEGKYADQARSKTTGLDEDEDDKAWKKALSLNTTEAYQNYLKGDGIKKYQQKARDHLKQIAEASKRSLSEEEIYWDQAKQQGTYLDYLDFIQRYPGSSYQEEAQKIMNHLDDLAFSQIKMTTSSAALDIQEKIAKCLDYFDQYPGAPNNAYVKRLKDKLQIKQIKTRGSQ